jgi:UDP-N-acetylmuramoyl-L-alanyl-D-glutamate--2,6-diaminopimelate ligase
MMAAQSQLPGVRVAQLLEGLVQGVLPDVAVSGLATDSRLVQSGDLFLASEGLQVHAISHAAEAVRRGAVAVVWEPVSDEALARQAESLDVPVVALAGLGQRLGLIADRFYAHPSQQQHVIGVTGTDGKTSVTHYLAQALSDDGVCGLLGTLGYGVYGQLQSPTHTTPDAVRLQAELARLRDDGVKVVAMEVSSHALHQHRSDGVAFNTAILTHLSRDHLDYHGSIEAYADAKRRLFGMPGLETAVLNVDDEFGRQLAGQLQNQVRVIVYGQQEDCAGLSADWIVLEAVTPRASGLALRLNTSWGPAEFETSLLGEFNASNLMAALGGLLAAGMTLNAAVARLSRVTTVAGRMELFEQRYAPRVVVDYAHTPHALETVLRALRPHCSGELVCLFGAGGDRDTGKRPQMGKVAERYADRVVLTSDNPRSEQPQAILDDIAAGLLEPQRAECIVDRGAAIDVVIAEGGIDDLILVAGKGHEDTQQIGSRRLAFSDRDRVRRALRRYAG